MLAPSLGTFVTYNPRSIAPETLVREALALMDDLKVHHLPVVDDYQQVVGIVSHRDLASYRQAQSVGDSTVSRVMARRVFTVDQSASPRTALQAILDYGFHSVPVLDDGQLVGMMTSTDFLRELSYGELGVGADRVADHMVSLPNEELLISAATETDALIEESSVVSPDQSLATAAALMLEFSVREIVVVDDFGHTLGVLREDDMLRAIVKCLQ